MRCVRSTAQLDRQHETHDLGPLGMFGSVDRNKFEYTDEQRYCTTERGPVILYIEHVEHYVPRERPPSHPAVGRFVLSCGKDLNDKKDTLQCKTWL